MAWFWIVKPIVLPPLQIYLLCFDGSTILEENPIVLDMTANGPYSRGRKKRWPTMVPLPWKSKGCFVAASLYNPYVLGL